MKNKIKFGVVVFCVICLCGCSLNKKKENSTIQITTQEDSSGITEEKTITDTQILTTESVVYKPTDLLPIIVNGKNIGFATINQLEKLKIVDWGNKTAVSDLIDHSYSINVTINYTGSEKTEIGCIPTLVKGTKEVSDPCTVGWSGFASVLSFNSEGTATLEAGFQPTVKNEKNCGVQLVFTTTQGNSEPVVVKGSLLKNVKKGPSLKKSKTLKVKSATGGVYTIKFKNMKIASEYLDSDLVDVLRYDVEITYNKKPNKFINSRYDEKNGLKLYTTFSIGSKGIHDSNFEFDSNPNVYGWNDKEKVWEPYVEDGKKSIKVGESTVYKCNRVLKDSGDTFQFCIEFPEEVENSSDKEIMNFNGRFCVFQFEVNR